MPIDCGNCGNIRKYVDNEICKLKAEFCQCQPMSIPGRDGSSGSKGEKWQKGDIDEILFGQGVPNPLLGNFGDVYIDTLTDSVLSENIEWLDFRNKY